MISFLQNALAYSLGVVVHSCQKQIEKWGHFQNTNSAVNKVSFHPIYN